jgi:hypothetical protein
MTLAVEAPTSEIIGAMRGGTYDPERYRLDADLPEALRR